MNKRPRLDFDEMIQRVPNGAGKGPEKKVDGDVQAFIEAGVLPDGDVVLLLDEFRELLYEEQQKLLQGSYLSYEVDGAWKWLVNGYKPENRDQIESVLVLLFGVFLHCGCGRVIGGNFQPFELFFPHDIVGRSTEDRGKTLPFYRDHENPSVYIPGKRDIMYYITSFTNTIKRIGYFREGTSDYFAPDKLESEMHLRLAKRLLGDQATSANPYSGLLPSDGFGVKFLNIPDRQRWAINDFVLFVRDPLERQDWDDLVFSSEDGKIPETRDTYISQLAIEIPDVDAIPAIPHSRYFKNVDTDRITTLCRAINGIVFDFVDKVDDHSSDDEKQQLVSDWTVDLMHTFCPTFMSYIGVQYLQRICIELQSDRHRHTGRLGSARAYFADPEFYAWDNSGEERQLCTYMEKITPAEARLVAAFVEVFGSMFFSSKTYISAFIGEAGSGKNFIRKMAIIISGGHDHTFRIDPNHGKFSLSMLKPWTNLLTVEDPGKSQIDIPSSFMDAALGGTRGKVEETAVVEAKFGHPEQQLVNPMGCCYLRNDPTEEALNKPGLSLQGKIAGCVMGFGGGRERRTRVAPPLMYPVQLGTVNGSEDCASTGRRHKAFDDMRARSELPFMMVVSWMTTILGDLCRDEMYGLIGTDGNEELDNLNKMYVSMGKSDVKDNVDQLLERCSPVVIKNNIRREAKDISISYGISSSVLKAAYYKKYKKKLESIPEEYGQPKSRVLVCRDCGRSFSGFRANSGPAEQIDKIEKIYSKATCQDRHLLVSNCEVDGQPCYKKLVNKSNVIMDVRFNEDRE